jgi:hypothetical protein
MSLEDRISSPVNWFLIAAGAAMLLFVVPHDVSGDGRVRYEALVQLLEQGKLVPTAYSLVGPLFSTPFYYLGKVFLGPVWWCSRYNAILLLIGLSGTFVLLRRAVDRRVLDAFCLIAVAASMFPAHVLDYFGETFTAVCVLLGVAALAVGREGLGWTAMVVGVVNTPASIVGLAFMSARHTVQSRRLRHVLPVVAAVLLIMAESWLRRGGPFVTGYEGNAGARTVMPYSALPGFSYPFFFGVLSILFSFGKGLLFFAPGLLISRQAIREGSETFRECLKDLLWFVAGLAAVYAKWWSWYGGSFWGPRFFLIASVPASLAIAGTLQRRRELSTAAIAALLGVLSLSAWVGMNGPVFNQGNLRLCSENHYALEFLCWYTPEFSVLWRPFVTPPTSLTWQQVTLVVYCALVYLWLAAPIVADLGTRIGRSFAAYRATAGRWRF